MFTSKIEPFYTLEKPHKEEKQDGNHKYNG